MFINLTPHIIRLQVQNLDTDQQQIIEIEPSGTVATCATIEGDSFALRVGNFEFTAASRVLGPVSGLPAPQAGCIFIVSSMVLDRVTGRPDVFAPDTGKTTAIRRDGQVWAVTRLVPAGL